MKKFTFVLIMWLSISPVFSQPFAHWDEKSLTLDNGAIKRQILFGSDQKGIVSQSMKLAGDDQEFLYAGSEEFAFNIDGKKLTGLDAWKLISITKATDENDGNGALVTLENSDLKLQIGITYLLYPKLPLVRKKISFTNQSGAEINLEGLDTERLRFEASGTGTESWVLNDYARQKSLGQFVGNWYDPIVLGDPRKLSADQRTRIKHWADWLRKMQTKHDFMSFRQDLPGFGEPMEGCWDGYQRVNTDTKSGGIVGVFRQGAKETQRTVTVQMLDPVANYRILSAPEGKKISSMTGKELAEKGFNVQLTKEYDGLLFQIQKNNI